MFQDSNFLSSTLYNGIIPNVLIIENMQANAICFMFCRKMELGKRTVSNNDVICVTRRLNSLVIKKLILLWCGCCFCCYGIFFNLSDVVTKKTFDTETKWLLFFKALCSPAIWPHLFSNIRGDTCFMIKMNVSYEFLKNKFLHRFRSR